ncbi:DoxX family protein [Salinactinospora qingdaonensis]|uniref:DoxX protein n=1 Tax=Salinactinospora qingdaonensis TaxID=702744 RepID=A0ABP7GE99_9ACTN
MGLLRTQARRLLAIPFLLEGVQTLRDPAPRAKELSPVIHELSRKYSWLPDNPELLVRLQGATGVAGSALLMSRKAGRLGCAVLAVQSLPTLVGERRSLTSGDLNGRDSARTTMAKDLSLLSALVLVATEPKRRPPRAVWEARHTADLVRRRSLEARQTARQRVRKAAGRMKR